jgi:hypothetical protein
VVRWRLVDLVQWLWERLGLSVSRQTLGRELRAMGYAKLSARPRHYAQDPEAADQFKKAFRRRSRRSERVFPPTRRLLEAAGYDLKVVKTGHMRTLEDILAEQRRGELP